jgi:uncharacterized damage-inducible protein DinB
VNTQVTPLFEQLKLNTRLFTNALDGADDDMAQRRPAGRANNMVFVALHLLDARAYLARYLGIEYQHPFTDLDAVSSIDEMESFPPLEGVCGAWREVSDLLVDGFPGLTEAELGLESAQPFPVDDRTVLGGVTFLLQHESFHIGQLAFLRRWLDLEPMSYT